MRVKIKSPLPKTEMGKVSKLFRRFGHHLRPHKKSLAAGSGALIGMAVVEIARPWPLKIIFDYVLLADRVQNNPFEAWNPLVVLGVASAAVIGLALVGALLSQIHSLSLASVGHKVAGAMRLELFSHVQRLPQDYHDYRQTGELMMRLTGDINLLKELLVSIFITLGSRILIVTGMLAVMLYLDWKLTLIALAILPLLFLSSARFSVRLRDASRRQRKNEGRMAATIYEGVDGVLLSKMFGQEKQHESSLKKLVSSSVRAGLRIKKLEASYERWVDVLTALGLTLVLFFGVREVLAGNLSPGSLLVFVSYLRSAYRPLRQIARLSSQMAKATVCGERVLQIMDMEPATNDKPAAISARHIKGEISFQDVSFSYASGQRALEDVSFHLPPGKTTAIIGASGAGKSTIAKLMMRLYEPEKGEICIDGVPIGDYRSKSLREQITPLSQESLLFRQTIRENISFGKPEATFDEIVEAARKVGAEEFIQALPSGYDTLIGEGGQTLSGGQRQRIAFARAALRNSRIMIFDEPATGLDPGAERAAQEALSILKADRTVLLITHRLNLLSLADWIVFLEDGKVAEMGGVDALLASGGKFLAFYQEWLLQTGEGRVSGAPTS